MRTDVTVQITRVFDNDVPVFFREELKWKRKWHRGVKGFVSMAD